MTAKAFQNAVSSPARHRTTTPITERTTRGQKTNRPRAGLTRLPARATAMVPDTSKDWPPV